MAEKNSAKFTYSLQVSLCEILRHDQKNDIIQKTNYAIRTRRRFREFEN